MAEQLENIQSALDAGCESIQLRFKNQESKIFLELAERVKKSCSSYNAKFIVNDNVEVAKDVDADGVHLGLDDMPVGDARKLLGENKIIGGTANTVKDVRKRIQEKCNYIGLGPFRFTSTKEKLSPVLGLAGYEKIMSEVVKNEMAIIPVYAVGGIRLEDIVSIMNTGIYGVAVSGALTDTANKKEWIKKFNLLIHE